jgi:hypothetical protein
MSLDTQKHSDNGENKKHQKSSNQKHLSDQHRL